MQLRIRDTELTLKVSSWLQIVGGIIGIGLLCNLMLQTGTINGAILLIFLAGLALFSYSIYCGKRLLTDQSKRNGVILSIINYAVQIFQWNVLGFGLSYSTGMEIVLGVEGGLNFKFNLSLFSTFKMAINTGDDMFIKVNLFALLMVFVLADILSEIKHGNQSNVETVDVLDDLRSAQEAEPHKTDGDPVGIR